MKYIPINWALMANPYNWVVIILMVAIAGYGVAILFNTPTEQST